MLSGSRPKTRIVPADSRGIAEAARLLSQGQPVIFPTETVYGLGANALDDAAVARVFAIKERPRFNPLILHVRDWRHALEFVASNETAGALAEKFWPGPLTLVLPRRPSCRISLLASAGLDTIAVRVPAHETAQALLAAADIPIAAPSANRSGNLSPTTADAAWHELDGRVELILEGGPCRAGIESTIIGFESGQPILLRPGAIAREAVEAIAGPLHATQKTQISAPGMLASHYAPRAKLRLNAREFFPGEAVLAFGPSAPEAAISCNLSPRGDLVEAGANLFAMLRRLDSTGTAAIAVVPIPERGIGEAINDRLRRGAAPRGDGPCC